MPFKVRPGLFAVALLLSLSALIAAAQVPYGTKLGDDTYQPSIGQDGKDVIWVPTHDGMTEAMLRMAQVGPQDLVYDLGAGDGKIAIAAASRFGAQAVGIEYNPDMAALARRNVQRAGVADKVKIIAGDIFVENFSNASVVTLYLLPELNLRLRPTILKMKPGTRVVANQFDMGDWEPDQHIDNAFSKGFFWIVPADVAGRWTIDGVDGSRNDTLELSQRYQKVGGTLTLRGTQQPLLSASLRGNQLRFSFIDMSGQSRIFEATVEGNSMTGSVRENVTLYDVSGKR